MRRLIAAIEHSMAAHATKAVIARIRDAAFYRRIAETLHNNPRGHEL